MDTIKDVDYVNMHSVNPLYFIINNADGYIEECHGNIFSWKQYFLSNVKLCLLTLFSLHCASINSIQLGAN